MQHYRFMLLLVLMFTAGWLGHQWFSPHYAASLFSKDILKEPSSKNVIYEAPEENIDEPVLVRKVSVILDRPEQIMLELEYTYEGPIPAKQIKLFVYMNSPYTYIGSTDVIRGTHSRRISIALDNTDLKKDDRFEFTTHEISMSFEHYLPEKYMGVVTKTMFPYKKHWQLIE